MLGGKRMVQQVLNPSPSTKTTGFSSTLWLFLALVAAGSAVLDALIIEAGGVRQAGLLLAGVMCIPALAAVLALLLTRRSLAGIGWGHSRIGFIALAIFLPVVIITPVYAIAWGGGLAGLDIQEWSVLVEENFG